MRSRSSAPSHPGRAVLALASILSAIALPAPGVALAAWPGDPFSGNVPLSLATGSQQNAQVASDGAGGAIVVWEDQRAGQKDIYVQRVSAAGTALWTADGVAVCTAAGDQLEPRITPDGFGGAVITWRDGRSAPGDAADIYAQRVNASGVPQWAANGVVVCDAAASQWWPEIVADGTGGAIIVWADQRGGPNRDIYIQRLNSVGSPRWTANGVLLRTAANSANSPKIIADGAGGAIAVWEDNRGASTELYAQRVNSTGVPQWTANGVDIGAGGYYRDLAAVADGAGGMIVAWTSSFGADWDVRAQRVTASGSLLWFYGGVLVSGGPVDQHAPQLAPDGSGGAIIAFEDSRTSLWQVAVQRMSAGGGRLWGMDGVALTNHTEGVGWLCVTGDGAGGGIVAWLDGRASAQGSIYAQRVSGAGIPLWTADGVPLCGAAGHRLSPAIVADASGGAIVVWEDYRSGSSYDVWAQRVDRHGEIGEPAPSIAGVTDVPNDQGGFVRVSWDASDLDVEPEYGIAEYRLYRNVPGLAALAMLALGKTTGDSDVAAAGGTLLELDSPAGSTYWEFVGSRQAQAFAGYSLVTATTADSVDGSNPHTLFMIEARAGSSLASPRWFSAPDSGYSVDNLAPAPPGQFAGSYAAGASRLSWQPSPEADFATYRLHRGATPDFVPDGSNLVSTQPDTGYVDPAGSPRHYKLAAVDVHGNVSRFASWSPNEAVGVPARMAAGLVFAPPAPNPAAQAATLGFALPGAASVRLAVLDVAGREVRVLADGTFSAGEHALAWDLRDASGRGVAAGVYFARLETNGRTLVRRVAVTR